LTWIARPSSRKAADPSAGPGKDRLLREEQGPQDQQVLQWIRLALVRDPPDRGRGGPIQQPQPPGPGQSPQEDGVESLHQRQQDLPEEERGPQEGPPGEERQEYGRVVVGFVVPAGLDQVRIVNPQRRAGFGQALLAGDLPVVDLAGQIVGVDGRFQAFLEPEDRHAEGQQQHQDHGDFGGERHATHGGPDFARPGGDLLLRVRFPPSQELAPGRGTHSLAGLRLAETGPEVYRVRAPQQADQGFPQPLHLGA